MPASVGERAVVDLRLLDPIFNRAQTEIVHLMRLIETRFPTTPGTSDGPGSPWRKSAAGYLPLSHAVQLLVAPRVARCSPLSGAGWQTAAFVDAPYVGRSFGFERGFDHFDV